MKRSSRRERPPNNTPFPRFPAAGRRRPLPSRLPSNGCGSSINGSLEARSATSIRRLSSKDELKVAAFDAASTKSSSVTDRYARLLRWWKNEPVQIIHPSANAKVSFVDLRGLSPSERDAERYARRRRVERPFDLSRAPLIRISLLQLEDISHVTLTTLHHIISDGWSIGVFIAKSPPCIRVLLAPQLPSRYPDYAVWQRGRLFRGGARTPAGILGRSNSQVRRHSWSCRPTGRVRRCKASEGARLSPEAR